MIKVARRSAGRLFLHLAMAVALALACTSAIAANKQQRAADKWLSEASAKGLSEHPRWLDLLHYSDDGNRSEILSEDFFLSDDGPRSPKAELAETIEAYFAPIRDDSDAHPRCRYPARYLWINEKIDLPGYSVIPPFCDRLAQWARIDEIESVSLLLVSGYLGNPASAFGHSLLRFNTSDVTESRGLLDLTFNFGAVVPENEGTASYILRGLFGGYVAGFSDSYYYSHDLTYTRTEFRDI